MFIMEILGTFKSADTEKLKEHWLPLYSGELACGLFGISEDFVEKYLSLDEKFTQNKASTFYVRASGDSMSPRIEDQDILIVDRSLKPLSGSIIAVFYNGTPLCKQFIQLGAKNFLSSYNKKYSDIEILESDSLEIFGVVIGLARDFN